MSPFPRRDYTLVDFDFLGRGWTGYVHDCYYRFEE